MTESTDKSFKTADNATREIPTPEKRRRTRRRFLQRLTGGTLAVLGGTAAYGAGYEPNHPVIEHVTVRLRNLPSAFEGFRIAQLSDIHINSAFGPERLTPAIELVQQEKPDMIALTGDYIVMEELDPLGYLEKCAGALAVLSAPYGKFVSYGNHDFPTPPDDPPSRVWTKTGARPLCDQIAHVKKDGATLHIVGLRSCIAREVKPSLVLSQLPKDACSIVLWHEPDRAIETASAGGCLQLSGHTHGGQVVLPFIGPPLLPLQGRLYPSGLFQVGGMPLYVTRGIGLLPPMVRVNCPPEVTILTLQRG